MSTEVVPVAKTRADRWQTRASTDEHAWLIDEDFVAYVEVQGLFQPSLERWDLAR